MLHMSEINFTDLLIKAQDGDISAYNRFLKESSIYLQYRLKKWVYRQEVIEEITQEVLLGIHRNLHTFLPDREAKAWMMGIARFKIIDFIRKNPHKFQEFTKDVTDGQYSTNNDLEDDIESTLRDLPDLVREALLMTKVYGLSTKETALKLGIKENALRTRISRAIAHLRKDLKA
jgi:RNA polymerase sigma factor (sigma-70 family)